MTNQFDEDEFVRSFLSKNNISGISIDSRKITLGDLFFALRGGLRDGHDFIYETLKSGAGAVIADYSRKMQMEHLLAAHPELLAKIFYVADVQEALKVISETLYPKLPKNLIAVTGTNGKTSTVSYIRQILEKLKIQAASLGSLGLEFGCDNLICEIEGIDRETNLNTRDLPSLRKILHKSAEAGIACLAFEASSHGIDQKRIEGIPVDLALFTGFSRDHLDYHGDMHAYLAAKLKLFSQNLRNRGSAIINYDLPKDIISKIINSMKFKEVNILKIGRTEEADLNILRIDSSIEGILVQFIYEQKLYQFRSSILGNFQAYNLLFAFLSVTLLGFAPSDILPIIPLLKPASGRLQRVGNADIFVDYAHTPDALERVLKELRLCKQNDSKLIVIFGCGGDRDEGKRSLMGRVASNLADRVIITDDNPRTEDPYEIRKKILVSAPGAIEIVDRKEAIFYGVSSMNGGDILLIAGKGHEKYQIIKDRQIYMDDVEIAIEALRTKF